MTKRTRRSALKTLAAVAAVPVAQAQHQHESPLVTVSAPYKPVVLTAAEMKWMAALVDTIIPRTDTPGASDAGVPAFIDRRLRSNPTLTARLREGMAALDAEARDKFEAEFPVLTSEQRIALLTPIDADPASRLGGFFRQVKTLTVDGYYTSKEGLTQELGWHGNTYLTEFKGCTHPEHQS